MYILGINGRPVDSAKRFSGEGQHGGHGGNHNSAACLFKDGELLAFVEEERFTHVKHDGCFPIESIKYCLDYAGITLEDVDCIAFGWKSFKDIFFDRMKHFIKSGMLFRIPFFSIGISYFAFKDWMKGDVAGAFKRHFPKTKIPRIYYVPHHLAHAASSYRASGMKDAAVINFDGAGETTSTWLGSGRNGTLKVDREIKLPHSLGFCYSGFTDFLGFLKNNDEYKVMGLASYGNPRFQVDDILEIKQDGSYAINDKSIYRFNPFNLKFNYSALKKRFGKGRDNDDQGLQDYHKDIAASVQAQLEKAAVRLVKSHMERNGDTNLCLAGGVALNCKMNKEIREHVPVKNLFVQPAASDMGVALGAALEVAHMLGKPADFKMEHVYYGPEYSNEEIEAALKNASLPYRKVENVSKETATFISKNQIIGWFQGRMEVGPRALGNRSILGNPTVEGMDDIVNEKIKFREKWRPFCPSMLYEVKDKYLENACESPFMILTFTAKESAKQQIPAVIHIDGTARVQTVRREVNPKYYELIESLGDLTGHAVVMNTSFNIKGDTIVRTPEDAIRTFLQTNMDILAIGDFIVEKKDVKAKA